MLGVGEGIIFGIDAIGQPYVNIIGLITALYSLGFIVFAWISLQYFEEEDSLPEGQPLLR